MLYPFNALLSRMKYITRWCLMHSARSETLSEHSLDVAHLAHVLCLIAKRYTGTPCRAELVTVAALYHDAPEIITGDMPTPVKYKNDKMKNAYKALERESMGEILRFLPKELQEEFEPYITQDCLTEAEHKLLKGADRLSALIKCNEECGRGNREFAAAQKQQKTALIAMHCPEVDWFMEHCLPCYDMNLDELTTQIRDTN